MENTPIAAHYIFINYRRDDSSHMAGRIYDSLLQDFSPTRVFRDIRSIDPGKQFDREIYNALNSCAVFIAIIGERWLSITDDQGRRRLDDEKDWVRQEIVSVLNRQITVIPLLIGTTAMPLESELPSDIRDLCRRNAFRVRDGDFENDVKKLHRAIEHTIPIEDRILEAIHSGAVEPNNNILRIHQFPIELQHSMLDEAIDEAPIRKK